MLESDDIRDLIPLVCSYLPDTDFLSLFMTCKTIQKGMVDMSAKSDCSTIGEKKIVYFFLSQRRIVEKQIEWYNNGQ